MRQILVLSCVVLLGGCSSVGYSLSGVPIGNQQVMMERGAVSVRSEWRGSAVSMTAANANFKDQLGFWVSVENRGVRMTNFGTENIAISPDGRSWQPVETFEQIVSRLENKAFWDKMAASVVIGLEGGMLSSMAGRSDINTTVRTRWGTATANTTIVDHGEQARVMAGTQAAAMSVGRQIDAEASDKISELEKVALRTTTVRPDEAFGGLVLARCPGVLSAEGAPFYVRVNFSGDDHVFLFQSHKPGGFITVQPDPLVVASEIANAVDSTQIAAANPHESDVAMTPISTASYSPPPATQTPQAEPPLRFRTFDSWQKSQDPSNKDD